MTTTVNLRRLLDRKQPEMVAVAPFTTGAGIHIANSRISRQPVSNAISTSGAYQMQYALQNATAAWEYLPEEDAWAELPNPNMGGTFAAGATSVCTPYSAGYMTTPQHLGSPLTAIASGTGSTSTVVTTNNYGVNALTTFICRAVGGTTANLNAPRTIASNTATTITLNATISSATAIYDTFSLEPISQITAAGSSTSTLINVANINGTAIATTGNLVASTLLTFQVRCIYAANTTSAVNLGQVRWITANTTTSATVGVAFSAAVQTGDIFAIEPYNTVTANGSGSTTTIVTGSAWTINQFSGYQVRALTGTGTNLGQVRLVLSNTATTITLQTALITTTASSDTFVIEPIPFAQTLTYTGIATSGGSTTTIPITGAATWIPGQWANSYQVRITSGTGAGQIRQITNNTAAVLTISPAIAATPDATTNFVIEPTIAYGPTISIATNQTLLRDLRGFKIRVMTAGNYVDERTILSNTIGQNAIITVTAPFSAPVTSLISMTLGTAVANSVGSTTTIITGNTWVANQFVGCQVVGLSGTAGNIGMTRTVVSNTTTTLTLSVAFPSATASADTFAINFVQSPIVSSATASATGTNTTIVTANTYTVNQYVNALIRCTSGTAANLMKTVKVVSNTATTFTVTPPLPAATASTDVFEVVSYTGYGTTASGTGTSTTIVTTNTWTLNQYTNYQVRAISGTATNLGCVSRVASNTATTLTLVTALPAATATSDVFVLEPVQGLTTASAYQLQTPRWWVWDAYTASPLANQFKYYDYAYNTWYATAGFSAAAVQGVPPVGAAWGTDGVMVSTPSIVDTIYTTFATGTSSGSNLTYTLNDTTNLWATNQFANYQVRITAGTGAGQVRKIAANTTTALYVPAWTTIPDSTSVYTIEGCDDNIYLIGNGAAAMYTLSISSGAWLLNAPLTARSGAPGAAVTASWIWDMSEATWSNENNIISGRRIYSFRGGAATTLDYYDIALNTWVSVLNYSPATTTFTTGSDFTTVKGRYIFIEKEATNRWYRFDPVTAQLDPLDQFLYPQGAAVVGNTAFDVTYTDGASSITWIYMLFNTSTLMNRFMII